MSGADPWAVFAGICTVFAFGMVTGWILARGGVE